MVTYSVDSNLNIIIKGLEKPSEFLKVLMRLNLYSVNGLSKEVNLSSTTLHFIINETVKITKHSSEELAKIFNCDKNLFYKLQLKENIRKLQDELDNL